MGFGNAEQLKRKSHGQLSDTRVYGSATYDTERRRCEIRVRVGELRMVEGIVKLGTERKAPSFMGPVQTYRF